MNRNALRQIIKSIAGNQVAVLDQLIFPSAPRSVAEQRVLAEGKKLKAAPERILETVALDKMEKRSPLLAPLSLPMSV